MSQPGSPNSSAWQPAQVPPAKDLRAPGPPVKLAGRMVRHRETGSYSALPEETAGRVLAVAQKIGVDCVDRIDPGYTDGVPIFRVNSAADRAKCHRALHLWTSPPAPLNRPPRECYGKGMTSAQSRASALMEAVERYCGQRFPHQRVVRAEYREVRDIAVSPAEFLFPAPPPKCLHCRARERVCFRDLERVCREWTWGYSLAESRPVLVPAALVYYPYLSGDGESFMFNDTGGLAAGNTLEEALAQAMAEIIERDSLYQAFSLEDFKSMQAVDFSDTTSGLIRKFTREALPAGSISAFRIESSRLGPEIPTFTAFACYQCQGESGRRYFGGSGASLSPEAGLLRALTELEQQKVRQKAERLLGPGDLVRPRARPGRTISFDRLEDLSSEDIRSDVEFYLDRFKKKGLDVIAVDLTHPEIGIPVVRAVIPGLIAYSGSLVKESVLVGMMEGEHWNC